MFIFLIMMNTIKAQPLRDWPHEASEIVWVAETSRINSQLELLVNLKSLGFEQCQEGWTLLNRSSLMDRQLKDKAIRKLTASMFIHLNTTNLEHRIERLLWAATLRFEQNSRRIVEKRLLKAAKQIISFLVEKGAHDKARKFTYALSLKNTDIFDEGWETQQRRRIRRFEYKPSETTSPKNIDCMTQATGFHLCTSAPEKACKGGCGHRIECPCCYFSPSMLSRACKGR